jgi:hypothetical protein
MGTVNLFIEFIFSFSIKQNPEDYSTDQCCKKAPYRSQVLSKKDNADQAG